MGADEEVVVTVPAVAAVPAGADGADGAGGAPDCTVDGRRTMPSTPTPSTGVDVNDPSAFRNCIGRGLPLRFLGGRSPAMSSKGRCGWFGPAVLLPLLCVWLYPPVYLLLLLLLWLLL